MELLQEIRVSLRRGGKSESEKSRMVAGIADN